MIESHLADPGDAGHGLKDVAERLLGVRPRRIGTLIGEGRDQRSFAEVPLADAAPYAAQDVVLAWRLHEVLAQRRVRLQGKPLRARRLALPQANLATFMSGIGERLTPIADTVDWLARLRERRDRTGDVRLYFLSNMPEPFARVKISNSP